MGDIPVEKKLELVHQVRTQYQKNQYDLMNRENLLYGRTSRPLDSHRELPGQENQYNVSGNSESLLRDGTVKIRYAIAAVLVLIVILMDQSGKGFAGISMERIFQTIEADYGDVLAAWVEGKAETGTSAK